MTLKPNLAFTAAAGLLLIAGYATAQEPVPSGADASTDGTLMARLATADGSDIGSATFRPMRAGMHVEVDLTDLPPGPHGIHVHATGACTPDFAAAGGHLAPEGHEHGFAQTETPHPGDLPNLWVADDGTAHAEFLNWRLTAGQMLDADGSAVIVHEAADS